MSANYQPPLPSSQRKGQEAKKGYGPQKQHWRTRCQSCNDTRHVIDMSGHRVPCPRCFFVGES